MKAKLGTWIGTAGALGALALAGTASAQPGERPARMTAQQYRAELIRGDALNARYGLGKYSLAAQSGPRAAGMTAQQYRAELIRADALNARYGLGRYAPKPDPTIGLSPVQRIIAQERGRQADGRRFGARDAAVAPSRALGVDGFDWGDAAIGAGAGVGFALLVLGGGLAARQGRRTRLSTAP